MFYASELVLMQIMIHFMTIIVVFADIVVEIHINKFEKTTKSRKQSIIFDANHACFRNSNFFYLS